MSAESDVHDEIVSSWTHNAQAWTAAVRDGLIASRKAGSDAAIVQACVARGSGAVLDVGCGEGWLVRELTARGTPAAGVDVSPELIASAIERGGGEFEVATYAALERNPALRAGPWHSIVCNFALLGEPVHPLLNALRQRLAPGGAILIQTVHPWAAKGEGPYRNEWRTESFASFAVPFPASMPWFYRTLGGWLHECALGGLVVSRIEEPVHPETGVPLSLLLHCEAR